MHRSKRTLIGSPRHPSGYLANFERIDIDGRNEGVRELNPFLIDPTGTAHHVAFWTGIAAWHEKTKEQSYDY